MTFYCERIRSDHDLKRFSSGNDELDRWLTEAALTADRSGITRTYILVNDSHEVVAYFAFAPHLLTREEAPKKVARTSPVVIPSILLAKLALDRSLHGHGHGGALLAAALEVALEAIRKVGGRLIVVDAIDERAARFTLHHGFTPVPGNPARLVMKASVAASSLGVPWP